MATLKNFIEELDNIIPSKNKHALVESKALHIIASASHLAKLIRETYPDDIADDLVKRLHKSILSEDNRKFVRKIKELRKNV